MTQFAVVENRELFFSRPVVPGDRRITPGFNGYAGVDAVYLIVRPHKSDPVSAHLLAALVAEQGLLISEGQYFADRNIAF